MNSLRMSMIAAGLTGALALSAAAETVTVNISNDASYEQSLICYQFHGVSSQVMKAASESEGLPEEEKQRLAMMSGFAGYLQQHWRAHISDIKGERTLDQVNADLQEKTKHVIADAQSGLAGDKDARARQQEVEKSCVSYEDRKVVEDAEPAAQ